jgi:protein ImuB
MLTTLAARAQALAALWVSFLVDRDSWRKEQIRPAVPTLDPGQILDLARLRLESMQFAAGVIEIELEAESCGATVEQLCLFERLVLSPSARLRTNYVEGPARDLDAANRSLAHLRAEFGDDAVVQAKLKNGHLPEARFAWEPLSRVKLPEPKLETPTTLVRRVLARPISLPGGPRHTHEDGWLILGHKYGSVDKLSGPYVFSGGWWNKEPADYYSPNRRGANAWVYYDRVRRRWFLQDDRAA